MGYVNLLAKIESEINETSAQLNAAPQDLRADLVEKKNQLKNLAYDYVRLEGKYKELAGLNSVY